MVGNVDLGLRGMSQSVTELPMTGDSCGALSSVLELTGRMSRGSEDAFKEFFDRYSSRLYAYVLTIADRDEALAAEALQQVMIRVGHKIKPFESEDYFWNWLAQIARRVIADERRKGGRWTYLLRRFWLARESGAEVAIRESAGDQQERLEAALARLADDDRVLIERKYYREESVPEMAATLGVSVKALESRLVRIRRRLRQQILRDETRNE